MSIENFGYFMSGIMLTGMITLVYISNIKNDDK